MIKLQFDSIGSVQSVRPIWWRVLYNSEEQKRDIS
jgi:hypothetical protein